MTKSKTVVTQRRLLEAFALRLPRYHPAGKPHIFRMEGKWRVNRATSAPGQRNVTVRNIRAVTYARNRNEGRK